MHLFYKICNFFLQVLFVRGYYGVKHIQNVLVGCPAHVNIRLLPSLFKNYDFHSSYTPLPNPIFTFTLLCDVSKGFMKALEAFIKPFEAPQRSENKNFT